MANCRHSLRGKVCRFEQISLSGSATKSLLTSDFIPASQDSCGRIRTETRVRKSEQSRVLPAITMLASVVRRYGWASTRASFAPQLPWETHADSHNSTEIKEHENDALRPSLQPLEPTHRK